MGQASNRPNSNHDVLDTVITNALIVDAVTGIIKADVGIKVRGKLNGKGTGILIMRGGQGKSDFD